MNPQSSQIQPSSQGQTQGIPNFQNRFQSQPQAQFLVQAQAQAQAQAHAQSQSYQQSQAQIQSHPPLPLHAQFQKQFQAQTSSPSLLNPGAGNVKRFPQKPQSAPLGQLFYCIPFSIQDYGAGTCCKKEKRRLPDKQLPDRVAALLPESALYTQLVEFESFVDAAFMRRKIDIQESLKNPPSLQKTLRIYVFNTFSNQTRPIPDNPNAEPPSWSLKIIGRILEDGTDSDPLGDAPKQNASYPKFSSFFKRITVALDPSLYPENPMVVWDNARSPVPHEGFEIKRKGDKEFTANIQLIMNYVPEKFKLSPLLTDVLGIEVDTRPRIIAAIWHYVKAKRLQNPNDPSEFVCDPPLRKVFGEDKMKFSVISQRIPQHLSPPHPIHLEHKIKLSGSNPAGNVCYDVLVDVPFPLQREMSSFLANTEKQKEIEACDEAICAAIKKIHEHRRRRAFFLGFSQSPVEFINALIASQSRDLKLLAGEGSRNVEREHRSDFYNQPWVEDAVISYLNRKPAAGNDVPGST